VSSSYYLQAYQAASRRHAQSYQELYGEDRWEEWVEEVGKIKAAWMRAVAGMLTQLDTNDPEIWHALGDAFKGGRGIERDLEQAEKWFRKSAATGHVRSMVCLGSILSREGRYSDELAESVQWLRRAADLGDERGMTWLGFAYREGTGVDADPRQAADWFIKAYAAGSKNAADLAGRVLAGNREDHPEAVKWLRTAADEGCDSSYYSLALICEDRESPEYNAEAAFRCWSRVAERPRGDLRFMAMLTLAKCCRDGIGTGCDRQEAKRWLDRLMALAPKEKADYRYAAKLRKEIDEELF
jgi:TPR repeat protein